MNILCMFPLLKERKETKFFYIIRSQINGYLGEGCRNWTREIGLLRCGDILSIDPCAGCKGVFTQWKCIGVCTHRIIWLCHAKPPPYPLQAVSVYSALARGGQSSGLCWAGLGCKLWDEGRALSTSLLLTGHSLRHVLLKWKAGSQEGWKKIHRSPKV